MGRAAVIVDTAGRRTSANASYKRPAPLHIGKS